MASRYPAPFSYGRDLRPLDPLLDLHREMNRLFDDVFTGSAGAAGGAAGIVSAPRIDVHEDEHEIGISAELPGVRPSEVDVRVDGDMLTISGEKKCETDRTQKNMHVMERSYGRFQRSIQLPFSPDPSQVRAEFNQGVLQVHLPKQAQMERSRRIEVREAGTPSSRDEPGGTAEAGRTEPSGPTTH
ncbi:MAG TPA: Hsp20/alpha crystallin family protein [Albitalea sp.]|nr:Hsp20/alpha crystallin family protein [Albitalea sp.]